MNYTKFDENVLKDDADDQRVIELVQDIKRNLSSINFKELQKIGNTKFLGNNSPFKDFFKVDGYDDIENFIRYGILKQVGQSFSIKSDINNNNKKQKAIKLFRQLRKSLYFRDIDKDDSNRDYFNNNLTDDLATGKFPQIQQSLITGSVAEIGGGYKKRKRKTRKQKRKSSLKRKRKKRSSLKRKRN
jgi:hypothetical protein